MTRVFKNLSILDILSYVGLIILSIFALLPYYYVLLLSLKPKDELPILTIWTWRPTLEVYFELSKVGGLIDALINTVAISILSSITATLLAIFSGYAYSRFTFLGKGTSFRIIILRNMFPGIVFLIPYYAFLTLLRLVNTYQGLILTYLVILLPLAVWLMTGFINSIPKDYEEQAMVDGCSRASSLLRVMMPILRPGVIAVFLYCFVMSWIEYAQPLTLWTTKKTLSVLLASAIFGETLLDWRLLYCMTVMMTIPSIVLFYSLQRYIRQGLVGGIKA